VNFLFSYGAVRAVTVSLDEGIFQAGDTRGHHDFHTTVLEVPHLLLESGLQVQIASIEVVDKEKRTVESVQDGADCNAEFLRAGVCVAEVL